MTRCWPHRQTSPGDDTATGRVAGASSGSVFPPIFCCRSTSSRSSAPNPRADTSNAASCSACSSSRSISASHPLFNAILLSVNYVSSALLLVQVAEHNNWHGIHAALLRRSQPTSVQQSQRRRHRSESISTLRHTRPVRCAASIVVPLPPKGSNTTSPMSGRPRSRTPAAPPGTRARVVDVLTDLALWRITRITESGIRCPASAAPCASSRRPRRPCRASPWTNHRHAGATLARVLAGHDLVGACDWRG